MKLLRHLFGRNRLHRRTRRMPGWIRRRIYKELLAVRRDEETAQALLELPVKPRLSIVDERWVVMLRPRDRHLLDLDDTLQETRDRHQRSEREESPHQKTRKRD